MEPGGTGAGARPETVAQSLTISDRSILQLLELLSHVETSFFRVQQISANGTLRFRDPANHTLLRTTVADAVMRQYSYNGIVVLSLRILSNTIDRHVAGANEEVYEEPLACAAELEPPAAPRGVPATGQLRSCDGKKVRREATHPTTLTLLSLHPRKVPRREAKHLTTFTLLASSSQGTRASLTRL